MRRREETIRSSPDAGDRFNYWESSLEEIEREFGIDFFEPVETFPIHESPVHEVEKVVAGRAVHTPIA